MFFPKTYQDRKHWKPQVKKGSSINYLSLRCSWKVYQLILSANLSSTYTGICMYTCSKLHIDTGADPELFQRGGGAV